MPDGGRFGLRGKGIDMSASGRHAERSADRSGDRSDLPFDRSRPVDQMSLTELSEQLDKVTAWIESERSKERAARAEYQAVADKVEHQIALIRDYARQLFQTQQRRLAQFEGLIGKSASQAEAKPLKGAAREKRTIEEAILYIWGLEGFDRPLTTEDISAALPLVGYETRATPRSLKSTVNQALAKLCRDGRMLKYRIDGSPLGTEDPNARARRYRPAPEQLRRVRRG
jgi:hypothetical protein